MHLRPTGSIGALGLAVCLGAALGPALGAGSASPSPAVGSGGMTAQAGTVCHDHGDGTQDCTSAEDAHQAADAVDVAAMDARDSLGATQQVAAQALRAIPVAPADRKRLGTWSDPAPWPIVGIHLALMPDGKVLAFDSVSDRAIDYVPVHNATRVMLWDPVSRTTRRVDVKGHNIFCTGFAKLPDGRLFTAGGNLNARYDGIRGTDVYNPVTRTWTAGPTMAQARWYPSVTPLSNGEMLITGGGPAISEVRTTAGKLRRLTSASNVEWSWREYTWLQTRPDGRVSFLGPSSAIGTLNPSGTGTYAEGPAVRDAYHRAYGSYAMYDAVAGKVLISGGVDTSASAVVVDTMSATASGTSSMTSPRRHHMLTILANGTVMAVGGMAGAGDALVDIPKSVKTPELWNPATGTWSRLANQRSVREYHSASLLLPDGRVISAGGGMCGVCEQAGYLNKDYEIYTPGYLYRGNGALAPRPVIASAPASARYRSTMTVRLKSTPGPIVRAALVRLGSATHAQDQEQRYVPLRLRSASATTVSLTAPSGAGVAPPGYYMLFVIDKYGVPSIAKMVRIGA